MKRPEVNLSCNNIVVYCLREMLTCVYFRPSLFNENNLFIPVLLMLPLLVLMENTSFL